MNSHKTIILPFGGCLLNNPLNTLVRLEKFGSIFFEIGLKSTPFCLSSLSLEQLYLFLTGEIDIPDGLMKYIYTEKVNFVNPFSPSLHKVDLVIIEVSTPYEYIYDGYILNVNRFNQYFIDSNLSKLENPIVLQNWKNALIKDDEAEIVRNSSLILKELASKEEVEPTYSDIIKKIRIKISNKADLTRSIAFLKGKLNSKFLIVPHNFRYLPSGAPISWPKNFKEEALEVAEELGIGTMDFKELVACLGPEVILSKDYRHWHEDSNHLVADFIEKKIITYLES